MKFSVDTKIIPARPPQTGLIQVTDSANNNHYILKQIQIKGYTETQTIYIFHNIA